MSVRKLSLACALVLLCSCSNPHQGLQFIYNGDNDGCFSFEMVIDDSLALYSTELSCRYDSSCIGGEDLPLCIELTSPSGSRYGEIVKLTLTAAVDRSLRGGAVIDREWSYRDNISSNETGVWKVDIKPLHKESIDGIYGIGFGYHLQK